MKCNMISLSFYLKWPWFKDRNADLRDQFFKCWSLSKNKSLEVQVSDGSNALIGFDIRASVREDHAGIMFTIYLFRRFLYVSFYDNRHWNDEENRYVNYDNPEEVEKYW